MLISSSHIERLQPPGRRPLVIAHRGACKVAPENTLAAFRLAIAMGADGVEMDVQLSSDRQPVVIHDLRVNRTTSGTGRVSDFSAGELGRLDAGSWFARRLALRPRIRANLERVALQAGLPVPAFAGEPVPTLGEALALLAPARLRRVYIELKAGPQTREPLLESVIGLVRDYSMTDRVTLLSFDHESVRRTKRIAPEMRVAATFPIAGQALIGAKRIIERAERIAADEVALHFGLAGRRVVGRLRERGIEVAIWTANSPLIMRRMVESGVDAIMTNTPDRLIGILNAPAPQRAARFRRGRL